MEEKEKTAEEKVAMVLAVVKEVEKDMEKVGAWIDSAITNRDNETKLAQISKEIETFAASFPLFA